MEKKKVGGARPGAGRPKGSTGKVTAAALLEQAEQTLGKSFIVSLMEGYRDSINAQDNKSRVIYEKMILDKVATTLIEADINDSDDAIESKKRAFAEALAALTTVTDKTK